MIKQNERIDSLIRESFEDYPIPGKLSEINKRILERTDKEYFWTSMINDFSIKTISIILLSFVPLIILLVLKSIDIEYITAFLKENLGLMISASIIIIAIIFLNEFTDHYLREGKKSKNKV